MRDGNRYSDNRGGGYGRRDSERSNFNDRGNSDRQMFPAVCDNCGKDCEVPFKPNGSKPIFCNECFREMGGNDREQNSERFDFKKQNFERRESPRNENRDESANATAYMKQQFDVLNTKLNKIMAALETKSVIKEEAQTSSEVLIEQPKVKKAVKKATKKKNIPE
ncbi:MAG: CxxC-x17-CxxC domain-containing protein [Candidatus Dojkabacteria bacterium]